MKKSKKLLLTLMSCFLVGALAACSKGTAKENTDDTPSVDPGGDPNPPTPPIVEPVYSVMIGTQKVTLTKGTGQYEATLSNLVKDASVTFYKDNNALTTGVSSEQRVGANNLIQGTVGNFYIHNDAASSQLTFKVSNNTYTFWATGYEEEPGPVTVTYTVSVGSVNYTLQQDTSASMAQGQTGQYVASLNNVKKDEAVVFAKDSQVITQNIGSEPESATSKNLIQGEVGNFVIHNDATTSTLYLKTWSDGGYSFWATGYEDEPEPPQPVETVYTIQVGTNTAVTLVKNESAVLINGQSGQYEADLSGLVKDEAVVFYADNTPIGSNIGSDPEDDENKNLIQGQVGNFVIHNNADASHVFFKTWSDGGYSFWATGYEGGEPGPVEVVYSIQIGEGTAVNLVKSETAVLAEGQKAQYEASLENLTKSQAVTFYADDVAINDHIGSEPEDDENKNLIQGTVGSFYINNDAAESKVFFKTWNDGGYSFWATGYEKDEPTPVTQGFYLVGDFNEWQAVEDGGYAMALKEGSMTEYVIKDVEIEGEEEFKVYDSGTYYGYDTVKEACRGLVSGEGTGNIKMTESGTYDIYFDTGDDYGMWIHKHGDVPPEPVEVAYTVKVGEGDPVELVKNEAAVLVEGQLAQYEADLTNLKKDDAVVFYADAIAIGEHIGSDPEDDENKNLIQGQVGEFVIHNDADASHIYFKTWQAGYSFWATGYQADVPPEPPVPVELKYYIAGAFGGEEWKDEAIELVEKEYEGDDETVVKQYHAEVAFAQNDKWLIEDNLETRTYFKTLEPGVEGMHNVAEDYNNIVIDTADTYDVYLKFYTEESGKLPTIWAKGQTEPVPPTPLIDLDWYVGGTLGGAEWNNKAVKLEEHTYEGEDETVLKEFHAKVEFAENDEWKVISDEEAPKYINAIEEGVTGMHIATQGDDNIVIDTTGTYDVYFKLYTEESGKAPSIWAKAQGEEPPEPTPVTYSVKVGDNEAVELPPSRYADIAEGQLDQYDAILTNLKKGEAVTFYADGVAITENIGSDPEDAENKNLIQTVEGAFVINNDADESTFYFKTWEDGGYSFWATGYESDEPTPVTQGFYLVGDFNEWQAVEDGGYAMALKEGSTTEYVIKDVEIDAEEEFKVYNSGDYYGFETVKNDCKGLVTGLENGNIKMNESGTYDIYFDTVEGEQHGMWIAKHSEPQPEELKTFYLDPGVWEKDDAWYAAYAFGGSEAATWFKMDKVGDYYTVEIDVSKYAQIIFCRMNPASEEMNWDNRWNQSSDLTIGENNLYTISGWGQDTNVCPGAWSTLDE